MDRSGFRKLIKPILLFLFIVIGVYLGRVYHIETEQIREFLSRYPLGLSGFVYIVFYVILTTLFWYGPKDILRIASAIFFGATISTVFIWIAELFNTCIMFHISRFLGREYVEHKLGQKAGRLDKIPKDHSQLGVFTWKLNPLIPTRFTDLGYGLSSIKFRVYVVPAIIAIIPRIYWQQYILSALGEVFVKDFDSIVQFYEKDIFFRNYTVCYILGVILMSAIVGIIKLKQSKGRV